MEEPAPGGWVLAAQGTRKCRCAWCGSRHGRIFRGVDPSIDTEASPRLVRTHRLHRTNEPDLLPRDCYQAKRHAATPRTATRTYPPCQSREKFLSRTFA